LIKRFIAQLIHGPLTAHFPCDENFTGKNVVRLAGYEYLGLNSGFKSRKLEKGKNKAARKGLYIAHFPKAKILPVNS